MKSAKFILLGFLLATYVLSYGQVGVDNTDPDPSSVLDLNATDKGLLIPRMTSTQRLAIGSPANSLLVFDTSLNLYFYYFNELWHPLNPWIPSTSTSDIYFNSGNVGIGTSSPEAKLDVRGPIRAAEYIRFANPPGQVNFITGQYEPMIYGSTAGGSIPGGSSSLIFQAGSTKNDRHIFFRTADETRMIILNNGNIGIGTATPRGKFDVSGAGDIYLSEDPNGSSGQTLYIPGHIYISPYSGSDVSYLQARRANSSGTTSLRFRTYNNATLTEAMHIEGNGRVGIGTTSPASRLHIADGNGGDQLQISRGTGAVRFAQDLNQDNLYLFNKNGSQTYMFWGANGNVGVGKSSPAYKLDVNGSVNATALYVNGVPVSAGSGVPAGAIIMWSGSIASIPSGWALCNGNNSTPDLRERFIVGAGGNNPEVAGGLAPYQSGYDPGDKDGTSLVPTTSNAVTLTFAQIPSHNHTYRDRYAIENAGSTNWPVNTLTEPAGTNRRGHQSDNDNDEFLYLSKQTENNTGGGGAHENRPPFYALAFIMKLP